MSRRAPPVSVLLPVRDGEEHLQDALDSISSQTLADFEAIVVDDGSSDSTPAILEAHARRDRRFRVVTQGPKGIVPALEGARMRARGRYLARMDADDVALPRRLESQMRLMEAAPGLAGCGARIEYFPAKEVKGGARRYERWINGLVTPEAIARDLFIECPLPHPTFFLRTEIVEGVGGYRDRGWPEDYDLTFRLWERGGALAKVKEVLLRWRERPGRLSRKGGAYSPSAFRRCKIHFLRRTLLRGRPGVVIWSAGPTGKAFARALLHEGVPLRAFVELDPRKIGQVIHGAPVIRPGEVDRHRGALSVIAIGQEGAREEARGMLRALGWEETSEFVAVA